MSHEKDSILKKIKQIIKKSAFRFVIVLYKTTSVHKRTENRDTVKRVNINVKPVTC